MNKKSKTERSCSIALLVLMAFLGGGCFQTFYLSAAKDREHRFDFQAVIHVALGNNISVWEKNLHGVVAEELKKAGFLLAEDPKKAQLVMTFQLSESSSVRHWYGVVPETNVGIGFLGARPVMVTTRGYRSVPYQATYFEKSVDLKVFRASDYAQKQLIPVWEGYIVGDRDAFQQHVADCVRKLVEQIGLDYEGRVSL